MAKEAYLHGKRGLLTWQKRPTYMAKEAYLILTWQKRPKNTGIPEARMS